MLANEFLAFEHSPLFFVDIIIHCSLLRTCRVRVEEKEEFLVYTVLWTLTCHPYLESATALSDTRVILSVQYSTDKVHIARSVLKDMLQWRFSMEPTYSIANATNLTLFGYYLSLQLTMVELRFFFITHYLQFVCLLLYL